MPELLLAADLLLHNARNEATGTVLVEALAAGLPVAASGCCGYAELVRESGGAVFAEPWSAAAVSGFLNELSVDPERLPTLRRAALAYGAQADFYHRPAVAADCMEQAAALRHRPKEMGK